MPIGDKKLLVVEDSEDLLLLWKSQLERFSLNASYARNGLSALNLASSGFVPDVLMTDYFLPDLTGNELILKLQSFNPRLKSLVISGNHPEDIKYTLPPDVEILMKPVLFDALKTALEKIGSGT